MPRYNSGTCFSSIDTAAFNEEEQYREWYTENKDILSQKNENRYSYKNKKSIKPKKHVVQNWIVTASKKDKKVLQETTMGNSYLKVPNKVLEQGKHFVSSSSLDLLESAQIQSDDENYGEKSIEKVEKTVLNTYRTVRYTQQAITTSKNVGKSIINVFNAILEALSSMIKIMFPSATIITVFVFGLVIIVSMVTLVPVGIAKAVDDYIASLTFEDLACELMTDGQEECEYLREYLFPEEVKEKENNDEQETEFIEQKKGIIDN